MGARNLNADTFRELRPMLFVTTYKMTKNVSDTEDILQDVMLDFLDKDMAGINSVKNYLARSVINRSLSRIEKRKQILYPGIDLPEPIADERYPELSSYDVSFGLLILLQRLTPVERAVFILKESFDYDYNEIANILDITTDNCRQLLHRAKEKVGSGKSKFKASPGENKAFSDAFMQASVSGDVQKFVGYLKENISIFSDGGGKVSAALNPIFGLENCLKFLSGINSKRGDEIYAETTSINGQPGIVFRLKATNAVDTVLVLEHEGDTISHIYIIRNPDKFPVV